MLDWAVAGRGSPADAVRAQRRLSIAYQVFGEGDLDLVVVPGFVSHVELVWEHEPARRWLEGWRRSHG